MRKEMREYCLNSKKCRRMTINEYFGFKTSSKPDICCDICDSSLGIEWDFANLPFV
jgi:superfamily II DNA helicase RecQ